MHIHGVPGILGLIIVQLFCIPSSWAQAAGDAPRSPVLQREYSVFAELHLPYERSRAALQGMLKAEGYESFAEGEREVVLVLTEAQIGKLFQARVRYRRIEASATEGLREVPYLDGARIPASFEKLIRRVYFDSQRG